MVAIFVLLQLALVVIFYAALTKLAARIFRRTQLSWKHAFVFGALATLIGTLGAVVNQGLGGVLPLPVALALGLGIQLCLGGWYLGTRARTGSGEPLAFKGGVLLSLVAYCIIFVVGVVAGVVIPMLAHRAGQA